MEICRTVHVVLQSISQFLCDPAKKNPLANRQTYRHIYGNPNGASFAHVQYMFVNWSRSGYWPLTAQNRLDTVNSSSWTFSSNNQNVVHNEVLILQYVQS